MPDPSSQDCCGRATVRNFISPQKELPPRCSRAPTRREFIRLLGGATAGWAVAAHAQQPTKLPTIGFLGQSTLAVEGPRLAAFLKRLRELGWIEGRTIAIEYGWGEGSGERFAKIAADFVRLKVDVIVTSGTANVVAAKQATSTTPIVFAVATRSPIVASLARPGGNVTGLSTAATDLAGKRVELLREAVPGLRRLAIIGNVGNPLPVLEMSEVQAAADRFGLAAAVLGIRRGRYRARLRGAQGARRRPLRRGRSAREHQPRPHPHLGHGGTTAGGI